MMQEGRPRRSGRMSWAAFANAALGIFGGLNVYRPIRSHDHVAAKTPKKYNGAHKIFTRNADPVWRNRGFQSDSRECQRRLRQQIALARKSDVWPEHLFKYREPA